ncbi:Hsp70 family protein [Nocardia miyunensis]|uniref:Hsp70 family protein n=1 Tax=Nocardia miyunensis TaxID=282684 RepID=UPI000834F68D|nr:Hsp70 family protein [Nocardia miyunensis]
MSIGTVNSVWAATVGEGDLPLVRVRRTAVTFDSAGGARIGGLPRFAPVVTDFADLTREFEPVVVGGRIWTAADLVAAVATCLIGAAESDGEPVIAYPACYSDSRVAALRHALDWAGASGTLLMPEPVAAVEWLDAEYDVSDNGLTLVYDLGGNSLDIAVVRTEADREKRGVLGKPVRSYEYGGRPLGATLARYARALSPGASSPVSKVIPADDTTRLRTWNIRNSLRLVRRCVRAAGLTIGDIDRILLVGGAARPLEVAQVIAELGRPVVISPDPAQTVAAGAALASFRMADTGGNLGRYARGAAVLSSAAVASALAMSAATMLGGGPIGSDGPALEFAPVLAGPAPDPARDVQVIDGTDPGVGSMGSPVVADAGFSLRNYSRGQSYGTVTQSVSVSTFGDVQRSLSEHGPGTHCGPLDRLQPQTYANPAQFVNPLPFASTSGAAIPVISLPRPPVRSGNSAPQHSSDHDTLPGTWDPSARVTPPAISKTSLTNPVATQPNTGTPHPAAGPQAGAGLPGSNSTAGEQNSAPGTSAHSGATGTSVRPGTNPGTNAHPGSGTPGTVHSDPAPSPGTGTSPGDSTASANTDTGGALSPGGHTTSSGPADGGPAPSSSSADASDSASSPGSGNGLPSSPGGVASQNMPNHLGGATPNSPGGAMSNGTSNSLGGATSHNSLGGATSNGTSNFLGGATSHNSLGGVTSHSTSNSAGGHSFGGGLHGGSLGGGSHGGSLGGGSHGGGGHH